MLLSPAKQYGSAPKRHAKIVRTQGKLLILGPFYFPLNNREDLHYPSPTPCLSILCAVLEGFPNILLEDHQIGLLETAVMPHERFLRSLQWGVILGHNYTVFVGTITILERNSPSNGRGIFFKNFLPVGRIGGCSRFTGEKLFKETDHDRERVYRRGGAASGYGVPDRAQLPPESGGRGGRSPDGHAAAVAVRAGVSR